MEFFILATPKRSKGKNKNINMSRILSKKMKKDVSWAQMGRNRKLTSKVKSLEKDDEEINKK